MYRQVSRSLLRSTQTALHGARPSGRRFVSTAPPQQKSRNWKSSTARWGLAIAAVYYYNTHPMFADNSTRAMKFDSPPSDEIESSSLTIDSYAASRKVKQQETVQEEKAVSAQLPSGSEGVTTDDPAALEEEADSQGAFNPVTGEINWDCPCLGGMAHGPCGQEFRNAFSCFVYSEQEPKGLDCIDKFKSMQDCFREHPDVYAAELDDNDELDAELAKEKEEIQRQAAAARQPEQPQKRLLDEEPSPVHVSPILSPEVPSDTREAASKPQSGPQDATSEAVDSGVISQAATPPAKPSHDEGNSQKEKPRQGRQ